MTSRRDFIKISAFGAGALAISSGALGAIKLISLPEDVKKTKG